MRIPRTGALRVAMLLLMVARGDSAMAIADDMGIARHTVMKYASRAGLALRMGRPRGTYEAQPRCIKRRRIIELHAKGEPNDVIAERLGVPTAKVRDTLRWWLPRFETRRAA